MKVVLKLILKISGSLLVPSFVLLMALLGFPQVLINDHFLGVLSHLMNSSGILVSWKQGHVAVESRGLFVKRVRFIFNNICIILPDKNLTVCFDKVNLEATGGLIGVRPRLIELGPMEFLAGRIQYFISQTKVSKGKKDEEKPKSKDCWMPAWLAGVRLLPWHIEIRNWRVMNGTDQFEGNLELTSWIARKGEVRVSVRSRVEVQPASQHVDLELDLESGLDVLSMERWKIDARARARLANGARFRTHLKFSPRVEKYYSNNYLSYTYNIDASYLKSKAMVEMKVSGEASPDSVVANLSGTGTRLVASTKKFWINSCKIKLWREESMNPPGNLNMNCPIEAEISVPTWGISPVPIPSRAGGRLVVDLKSSAFPPAGDSIVEGKVAVELVPILTPIFQGKGKIESQVKGVLEDFPLGWKLNTDVGLQVVIPQFQNFVKQLSNTPYDVWAPLRVLKGIIRLDVTGKFDASQGSVPDHLQTLLVSRDQELNVDANGILQIRNIRSSPCAHLNMDVALSKIQLELPPVPKLPSPSQPKPDAFPTFLPNGQIHSGPLTQQNQKSGAQQVPRVQEPIFTYAVKIHTVDDKNPIKFLSSQVKTPIPLAVNLALSTDVPLSGDVRVLAFPLELFRRKVQLEYLNLKFTLGSKDTALSGKIQVPYTDYMITILLLGTTEKPLLRFMSDPPLPDDQIVAVLVFGQPLEALDPDQQQSVGSSRAALRQGVLSLFSLYYLSSLNIERVDYDPGTRTASLRYRLSEGTSLNVSEGLGGGQSSVGIRKRLSKHLAITTTLNNSSEQQANRTLSTFLEWAYQY